jgi:hypothetical protein
MFCILLYLEYYIHRLCVIELKCMIQCLYLHHKYTSLIYIDDGIIFYLIWMLDNCGLDGPTDWKFEVNFEYHIPSMDFCFKSCLAREKCY